MESNRNKKKKKEKIIMDLTERKISEMQAVNELEFIVDSESENNSDDDDGTNDADDEQGEEEEISNMTCDFIRILDLFDEPEEKLITRNTSNEVVALKYDDGEEYRTQNPYPEHNDGVCR